MPAQLMMALALPALCFLLLSVILNASLNEEGTWHEAVLGSAIGLGVFVAIGSELMGQFGLLTRAGVTVAWLGLSAVLVVYGVGSSRLSTGIQRWRDVLAGTRGWHTMDLVLAGGCVLLAAILLVIALVAPPNTTDSLVSHMAKVAHWAQAGSLEHYAAFQHQQLWTPIWSQVVVLHLMQLAGGDWAANLVQWASMVISAVAVAGIARGLGASRSGQWLAVALALSAPMVVLQSTSTQNDLAAGLWIVITGFYLLKLVQRDLRTFEWLSLGAAVGLGMLTKLTYYPYIGLALVGAIFLAWRNRGQAGGLLIRILIVGVVAAALNLGLWVRNVGTYGSPLGHQETVSGQSQMGLDPGGLAARIAQHAALQFPTPSEPLNASLIQAVRSFSRLVGSPNDGYSVIWSWNHEDLAGSPIHFALIWIGILVALFVGRRSDPGLRWYGLAVLLGFLGLAWSIQSGVYRARYQVPFLLLGSPLVAAIADRFLNRRLVLALGVAFILSATPWVLLNQTRPAIGWRPRTRTESVFQTSRVDLVFANPYELQVPYTRAAQQALETDCLNVGLSLNSRDPEYALWWLLGAPWNEIRIQAVRPLQSLEGLLDPSFEPCAVICTNCGERQTFEGLPLAASFEQVRLYRR